MAINSSIINAGMLIGSIMSGELTTTFGYSATFIPAIVAFAVSFAMLSRTSGQKSIVIVEATKNADMSSSTTILSTCSC
jgi:hypothetical protein